MFIGYKILLVHLQDKSTKDSKNQGDFEGKEQSWKDHNM